MSDVLPRVLCMVTREAVGTKMTQAENRSTRIAYRTQFRDHACELLSWQRMMQALSSAGVLLASNIM